MAAQTDNKDNKDKTSEETPMHKQWWFILIVLLVLVAGGYFGYTKFMAKPQQSFAYYF